MCRAEDTYANFKLRSNESLAAELSIALGMLYRSNRTKLELTSPQRHRAAPPRPQAFQMDDLTRQVIDQLVAEGQIQGPAILAAVHAPVPASIRAQVAPRPVPAPLQLHQHLHVLFQLPLRWQHLRVLFQCPLRWQKNLIIITAFFLILLLVLLAVLANLGMIYVQMALYSGV